MVKKVVLIAAAAAAVATRGVEAEGTNKEVCFTGLDGLRTVFPEDDDYTKATKQFASSMGTFEDAAIRLHPSAIIFAEQEEDVAKAIAFAGTCGLKVSVRSGGHQYSGYSSCEKGTNCLQLDVSALETFIAPSEENNWETTVGVGLVIEDMVALLKPLERFVPSGICGTVGVGGHYQSSGMGIFTRALGSGLDGVTSFRIVKSDGKTYNVTRENDPELYWAVLGGSPGSWGVVLDYTMKTYADEDWKHTRMIRYRDTFKKEHYKCVLKKTLDATQSSKYGRDWTPFLNVIPNVRGVNKTPGYAADVYPHLTELWLPWTGVDSGNMTKEIYNEVVKPFDDCRDEHDMPDLDFVLNMTTPHFTVDEHQSATEMWKFNVVPFDFFKGFRYHEHTVLDSTWALNDDKFVEILGDELERRLSKPLEFSVYQLVGVGAGNDNSQVFRNGVDGPEYKGNSYHGRNLKFLVDDWQFFKSENEKEVVSHIDQFRSKLGPFVNDHKNGDVEHSWMSTETLVANDESSKMECKWSEYFADRSWYNRLQSVKAAADPCNYFSHDMTIPLPNKNGPNGYGAGSRRGENEICKNPFKLATGWGTQYVDVQGNDKNVGNDENVGSAESSKGTQDVDVQDNDKNVGSAESATSTGSTVAASVSAGIAVATAAVIVA